MLLHDHGAEPLSREPWNTGTGVAGEDMPRKSLDIRFTDHPVSAEKKQCFFSCFRRGRVWAEPANRVKGRVPCGFLGQRPKPSESFLVSISTVFKVHLSLFSFAPVFHRSLDTTILGINAINIVIPRSRSGHIMSFISCILQYKKLFGFPIKPPQN